MTKVRLPAVAAVLLFSQRSALAREGTPPFANPNFYAFSEPNDSDFSDYRPVLNADATALIFERTFADNPNFTRLYVANLTTNPAQVQPLVGLSSLRADWCWNRSNGGLTTGPIAFSNDDGIYVLSGTNLTPLPNTAGMVYPAWYPNCQYLAVDVGQNPQVRGEHVTALINAATGVVVAAPLANNKVWAGFPSVNQANANLVAFAGQFIGNSNYYNQDINYAWVTDRSRLPPIVVPLDRMAPAGPSFLQQFQARAGWWSPDGKWFAFESNRSCDEIDGLTYAIFIQPADGAQPAMQVTSCDWNANHPKWFPPGSTGGKTMLIAAIAEPAQSSGESPPYHIATLDVTAFVHETPGR
jgi:WD40-like Beta Propeller Repeat